MSSHLVSIIMPVWNSAKHLSRSVNSVREQDYPHWELIIIDDGSVDLSLRIAETFASLEPRIRIISLPKNSGPAYARNCGIQIARGRYITFLDADDAWKAFFLSSQVNFLITNNYNFVFANFERFDHHNNFLGVSFSCPRVTYHDLLKSNPISCSTAMYDAEYFSKIYMPLISMRQDLGLWLRLLKKTKYAYFNNAVLAEYHMQEKSVSSNKFLAAKYTWRLYREVENLGIFPAIFYFLHYAAFGYLKYHHPKLVPFFYSCRRSD